MSKRWKRKTRDMREGSEHGREIEDEALRTIIQRPQQYPHDEVRVEYLTHQGAPITNEHFDGFLQWVFDELVREKCRRADWIMPDNWTPSANDGRRGPEEFPSESDPRFRHKRIIMRGLQWVDFDIDFTINGPTNDLDEETLEIGVYTALRNRNPEFRRESFSVGEGMWDQVAHLL